MNSEKANDETIEWYTEMLWLRCAVREITRGENIDNNVEQLKKARRYLDQEIAKLEGRPDPDQLTMEGI
jgi:hypothetical protein